MLTAQTLEIHQLNVGQGDAAVIIAKKADNSIANVVLLDGGNRYNKYRDTIMNFLQGYFHPHPIPKINYMINTHYDSDHVGGLRAILRDKPGGLQIDSVFDRGDIYHTNAYNSTTSQNFRALANNPPNTTRHVLTPGQELVLYEDTDDGTHHITMTCVAVNGKVLLEGGGTDDLLADILYPDENDLSVAFLIEYGQFRYFTGGDIGGKNGSQPGTCGGPYGCKFVDIETSVAEYTGHVCAFKVNHHGSRCSTNNDFLNALNPKVAVISSGKHGTYKHPRPEVIQLLEDKMNLTHYYFTAGENFYARTTPKGSFKGSTVGIIVNKTNGGVDITVQSKFTVEGGGSYYCH